jgi:hypothetical protein
MLGSQAARAMAINLGQLYLAVSGQLIMVKERTARQLTTDN